MFISSLYLYFCLCLCYSCCQIFIQLPWQDTALSLSLRHKMYYCRQKMSRISGLSLYMCLYWLLCYDCGGCRLLAAAQSPSTPDSAPRMRTADRILSRPAVSSRRRCGCKHWHTLRHMYRVYKDVPTCSNICLKTWIVTLIFTNKYICVLMMRA